MKPGTPAGVLGSSSLERTSSNLSGVPRLALRKPDAAAACGLSDESFDRYVRPYVPRVRLGAVTVWPIEGLVAFLEARGEAPIEELELEEGAS